MFVPAFTYILPYHVYSKSAKMLRQALGLNRVSTHRLNAKDTVISWGKTTPQDSERMVAGHVVHVINKQDAVKRSSDKLLFFRAMQDGPAADNPSIPEFTTSAQEAVQWAQSGATVVGRQTANGHSGEGILFYGDGDLTTFLGCPLFTKYIKNKAEFRIHIAFGKIIDEQRKGLRSDVDKSTVDLRVKSHKNGFVFIREGINVPEVVRTEALKAFKRTGLDFGAFDVLYNEYYGKAYVLEANTAPGLEGQTVESYAKAFRENL
jgi:glutathione synthase/RimK-type ligase-like ATP-grasp enzyme